MTLKSRIALALAALAFLPLTPVLAADYDPPIYVDQAPDYQPVEVGSGWYLRGDVGYAFSHPFDHEIGSAGGSANFTSDSSLFTGSVGMGFHLNDYLRVELNGGILPTNQFSDNNLITNGCAGTTNIVINSPGGDIIVPQAATKDCVASSYGTNKAYALMANGYVDLGTYVGITPYLGGGLGLSYNKYFKSIGERNCINVPSNSTGAGGFACNDPAGYKGLEDSEAKFNLAYSIGAGISYQVSKNVSVDLGYEYFSVPSAKYVAYDAGTFGIHKGINYQTVKLGLRYDLW
ncbi:outer membrane protein [Mesorhizobium sp. INR15]|uniref:outer membrane protein n=1 Tax=Mesorhizobium sp. INR15 TaxID=2654248 RepID=UPI00189657EA|nr:outer membrane beta-barrel protein [Mesorhizobium sp. INR15]QPC90415.1 outer membrane beta-barrel protein [Mesorhizobium sp. INR15]